MIESIGQRLKKAREYRNLTIETVAEATRIRQSYLQALEADDFSVMPSPVQARGFLRNYAEYLQLDLDQIIEELRAAHPGPEADTEVIFEGEQTEPAPEPDSPASETEVDGLPAESLTEPFWQTWLRRVKREAGETDVESISQPDPPTTLEHTSKNRQGWDSVLRYPFKQRQTQDSGLRTVKGEAIQQAQDSASGQPPEPVVVSEPESTSETEASPSVENEADDKGSGTGRRTQLWISLLGWIKARIPHKQNIVQSTVEIEAVPELENEPEPEPQPDSPAEPSTSSQEIIHEIGQQLRERREMLSLTLDEIERHTRMRAQFMDSLEKGNFEELPSPVQTRGMLTNYARFLDLDVDVLLLRFADALQARHRERHPETPARRRGKPNVPESVPALRSFIAGDLVFGIGMILLLVVFTVWGITRVIALQSEQQAEVQVEATGPSISEALIGTPVETVISEVTLIPAEDTPIPSLPEGTLEFPTAAANVNVQVNIVAVERSFLRVIVDGEPAFEGRTIPGNAYPFEAEQSIEVLTGNGAALRVIYNQRDLGLLGGFGQIASFIYTPDEVLVPTPAVPPTATLTPFVSPTPSITPSPTATPPATPTPTGDSS